MSLYFFLFFFVSVILFLFFFFFFNDTATTEIYTLSLHDALPICPPGTKGILPPAPGPLHRSADRKSTRLNSSHHSISYAVFCLKKKKKLELSDYFTTVTRHAGRRKIREARA